MVLLQVAVPEAAGNLIVAASGGSSQRRDYTKEKRSLAAQNPLTLN